MLIPGDRFVVTLLQLIEKGEPVGADFVRF